MVVLSPCHASDARPGRACGLVPLPHRVGWLLEDEVAERTVAVRGDHGGAGEQYQLRDGASRSRAALAVVLLLLLPPGDEGERSRREREGEAGMLIVVKKDFVGNHSTVVDVSPQTAGTAVWPSLPLSLCACAVTGG